MSTDTLLATIEAIEFAVPDGAITIQKANALAIGNAEDYAAGAKLRTILKEGIDWIRVDADPLCKLTDRAHKEAVKKRTEALTPWVQADAFLKTRMFDWQTAERRRQEAEQKRLQDEAAAKEAKRQAEIEALRDEDLTEAAETMAAETRPPPTPIVSTTVPKVAGGQVRWLPWDYEEIHFALVPDKYKILNRPKILAEVRQHKEATNIPGIRPFRGQTLSQ